MGEEGEEWMLEGKQRDIPFVGRASHQSCQEIRNPCLGVQPLAVELNSMLYHVLDYEHAGRK